jgi:hypothetical protein
LLSDYSGGVLRGSDRAGCPPGCWGKGPLLPNASRMSCRNERNGPQGMSRSKARVFEGLFRQSRRRADRRQRGGQVNLGGRNQAEGQPRITGRGSRGGGTTQPVASGQRHSERP